MRFLCVGEGREVRGDSVRGRLLSRLPLHRLRLVLLHLLGVHRQLLFELIADPGEMIHVLDSWHELEAVPTVVIDHSQHTVKQILPLVAVVVAQVHTKQVRQLLGQFRHVYLAVTKSLLDAEEVENLLVKRTAGCHC